MYRLPCKDPAALSSKSWLQHTADSHVFSSVHIDSKIFPRLFSGFSVTDEIWTLPEGNQCLLDTLPSSGPWLRCGWFETHFCPFNQPFQSLRSHWHPATDVAVTVRSSINAKKTCQIWTGDPCIPLLLPWQAVSLPRQTRTLIWGKPWWCLSLGDD